MNVVPLLLGQLISSTAERFPTRVAVALNDRQLTFSELDDLSLRMAASLLEAGVERGDRVGWLAETSLEAVALYFATAHIGAIFTPFNPRYTYAETAAVLQFAQPRLVLSSDGREGSRRIDTLLAGSTTDLAAALSGVEETDPHVIFFTSGTSGEPKGCMLSQRTQWLRAAGGPGYPVGATVCMFPQFHMAGWSYNLRTWLNGDAMVYVDRPEVGELMGAVDRHRAAHLYCIPAVWERILDADRSAYDLSCLRMAETGTSATTPTLLARLHQAFPTAVTTIIYGSTETEVACLLGPADLHRKPGSVGPAAPGVHLRIDVSGELSIRSPKLFSGYFRNEAATNAALVDGWYRTGELARRDEDGYYYIIGRLKELIRTGGETVAPVEVDRVLQSHPAIADAAIAGIPHDTWGETISAFVVLRPGASLTLDDLHAFCSDKLVRFKHPRQLVLVETIPRTAATGQVQRRMLTELAAKEPS